MISIPRKLGVAALCLVAGAVLVGGLYYAWLITPPSLPDDVDEAVSTIGSTRYERLTDERKQQYMQRTRELIGQMPDEDRRTLFEQMRDDEQLRDAFREARRNQMRERFIQFAQASEDERNQIIDDMLDQMQQWQQRRSQRPSRPQSARPDPQRNSEGQDESDEQRQERRDERRANMRNRIQNMIQEGNAQNHAMMMEFRQAMQRRAEQRGMDMPNWGGRR